MDKVLLESLFYLLLISTINANETSAWNYNVFGIRNLISFNSQNIYETIAELTIWAFAFYILFFISKSKSLIISTFLFLAGIVYLTDGLSSVLVLLEPKNPNYKKLYDFMVSTEFVIESIYGFFTLYIIYYLVF